MEHRGDSPFSGPISPELVLVSSPEDARWARELLPEPGAAIARLERTERLVVETERPVETEHTLEAEHPLEPDRLVETERQVEPERPVERDPLEVLDPRSLFAAAEATTGASREHPLVRFTRSLVWAVPTAAIVAVAVIVALPIAGLTPKVRPYLVTSAAPAATLEDAGVAPDRDVRVPAPGPPSPAPLRPSSTDMARSKARSVPKVPLTPRTPLLSWPTAPGVRHYRVQLAIAGPRTETVVLSVRTTEPRLQVPETWIDGGRRRRRLVPGTYRWYVWPDDGTGAEHYEVPSVSGVFVVP